MSAKSELVVKNGECSILIAHNFIEIRQDDNYIRLSWKQFSKLARCVEVVSNAHANLWLVNNPEESK